MGETQEIYAHLAESQQRILGSDGHRSWHPAIILPNA